MKSGAGRAAPADKPVGRFFDFPSSRAGMRLLDRAQRHLSFLQMIPPAIRKNEVRPPRDLRGALPENTPNRIVTVAES